MSVNEFQQVLAQMNEKLKNIPENSGNFYPEPGIYQAVAGDITRNVALAKDNVTRVLTWTIPFEYVDGQYVGRISTKKYSTLYDSQVGDLKALIHLVTGNAAPEDALELDRLLNVIPGKLFEVESYKYPSKENKNILRDNLRILNYVPSNQPSEG
jgi:hypothetical protein